MKPVVVLLLVAGLLSLASGASAQAVVNPRTIEYMVSADHATLTKYILGFFLLGATAPVQAQDLPIVAPDAQQKVTQPIDATPLGFGSYVGRLRSVAGTVEGEWSEPSNDFVRAPLPPSAPTVRR